MQDPPVPGQGDPRWEYKILWRYGPLSLLVVGLALLGVGASGLCATAVSVTLLPIGLVCLLAGVVLPRIEGMFTAGPQGISAPLLAVHKLDQVTYTASARAVVVEGDVYARESPAIENAQSPGPIKLGDVWDALEGVGFYVVQGATGRRYLNGPHGGSIGVHGRELLGWAIASDDLLAQLGSWDIQPVASGNYPTPPGVDPIRALRPYSALPVGPPSQP